MMLCFMLANAGPDGNPFRYVLCMLQVTMQVSRRHIKLHNYKWKCIAKIAYTLDELC